MPRALRITSLFVALVTLSCLSLPTWADTRRFQGAGPPVGAGISVTGKATTGLGDVSTATGKSLLGFVSGCTTNCVTVVNLFIRQDPTPPTPSCTVNAVAAVAGTVIWDRQNNVGQYCGVFAGQTGTYDIVCDWTGGTARAALLAVRALENVDQTTPVKDQDTIKSTGVNSSSISVSVAVATDMMLDGLHIDNVNVKTGTTGQTEDENEVWNGQGIWTSHLQGTGTLTSTVTWTDLDPRMHCAYLLQEAP